jgi:Erv1 / Alr family
MPCACKNPPINVPDNMEWGPVFWRLLHGMAEHVGNVPMPGLRGDEMRAWKVVLTTLDRALPCEHCRDHLKGYVSQHPINIPDDYSQGRDYIRRWLYELHEDVNGRLGKGSIPYSTVDLLYHGVPLRSTYDVLNVLVKRSIQGTAVPLLSWNNWAKQIKILFGLYT